MDCIEHPMTAKLGSGKPFFLHTPKLCGLHAQLCQAPGTTLALFTRRAHVALFFWAGFILTILTMIVSICERAKANSLSDRTRFLSQALALSSPPQLQWWLDNTAESISSIGRGLIQAASSDNVQLLALLAVKDFVLPSLSVLQPGLKWSNGPGKAKVGSSVSSSHRLGIVVATRQTCCPDPMRV